MRKLTLISSLLIALSLLAFFAKSKKAEACSIVGMCLVEDTSSSQFDNFSLTK